METDVLCLRREWFLAVAPRAAGHAVPRGRGAKFYHLRACPIFRHVRSKQLWRWTKPVAIVRRTALPAHQKHRM